MYGTYFYSGPIGMFCSIIYFSFKKALSSTSFANVSLTLQYINPIEVLQDQYKGWESRCYHIQTVVFTNTTQQLFNNIFWEMSHAFKTYIILLLCQLVYVWVTLQFNSSDK